MVDYSSQGLSMTKTPQHLRPIFIIGPPRSGTTLLKDLLNLHPQLDVHGQDYHEFHHNYPNRKSRLDFEHYYFTTADADADCRRRYRQRVQEDVEKSGCRWFILKISTLSIQIDYLKRIFPDARFIQLVRDGRDTICSLEQLRAHLESESGSKRALGAAPDPWGLHCADQNLPPLIRAAASWMFHVGQSHGDLRFAGADSFLRLRYEDLVQDPQASLGTVLSFIDDDLKLAEEMHGALGEISDITTEAASSLGFSDSQSNSGRRIGRHLEEISPNLRVLVSALLHFPMQILGYTPDSWPYEDDFFAAASELGVDAELLRDLAKSWTAYLGNQNQAFEPSWMMKMQRRRGDDSRKPILISGAEIGTRIIPDSTGRGCGGEGLSYVEKQDRRYDFRDDKCLWPTVARDLNGELTIADLRSKYGLTAEHGLLLEELFERGYCGFL